MHVSMNQLHQHILMITYDVKAWNDPTIYTPTGLLPLIFENPSVQSQTKGPTYVYVVISSLGTVRL
jgi:hypothetical protein